jgi:hypothetical protein
LLSSRTLLICAEADFSFPLRAPQTAYVSGSAFDPLSPSTTPTRMLTRVSIPRALTVKEALRMNGLELNFMDTFFRFVVPLRMLRRPLTSDLPQTLDLTESGTPSSSSPRKSSSPGSDRRFGCPCVLFFSQFPPLHVHSALMPSPLLVSSLSPSSSSGDSAPS